MKGTLAAFDTIGGRSAAAFLRDGVLDDLLIDPPAARIRPGTIYRATANRPMKGQGGVMLTTPDGPVFLRQTKGIVPGETYLVQTTTYAEAGKAAPVTTRLTLKSRYVLVTPDAPGLNISRAIRDEQRRVGLRDLATPLLDGFSPGLIIRSAAEDAEDADVADDIRAMTELARQLLADTSGQPERLLDGPGAEDLAFRDWARPDATDSGPGTFERHGIDDLIASVRAPEQALPGGGHVVIEPTRALVAVDVNTGGDTSPAAGLKVNIAAVRALPRLLRLRGLGGQIVLDLAPMPKRDRVRVEQQIKSAFRADPIDTAFVGWTPLGHAELQRKRERLPLEEALS